MKVSVLGCGRWGSCIAWYLDKTGHEVLSCGLSDAPEFIQLKTTRKNDYLSFPESIEVSDDLEYAVNRAEVIIISISSQYLRSYFEDISKYLIKWAALFGIIAVTMKALPSILSTIASEKISGDTLMSLFEGLTMFIGGIILISSLSGTKLFATADAWYNQLISAATMIGVIAVTFALLPPVIEALGKSGIGDKNVLETFEGLTMFIGGIGLVLGILGKIRCQSLWTTKERWHYIRCFIYEVRIISKNLWSFCRRSIICRR